LRNTEVKENVAKGTHFNRMRWNTVLLLSSTSVNKKETSIPTKLKKKVPPDQNKKPAAERVPKLHHGLKVWGHVTGERFEFRRGDEGKN